MGNFQTYRDKFSSCFRLSFLTLATLRRTEKRQYYQTFSVYHRHAHLTMKKLFLAAFLLTIGSLSAVAQLNQLSIGSWRMHIPYSKGVQIDEGKNGILYCATKFGIFSYSKTSGEFNYFTTLNGLSDHEVSNLRYNADKDVLVITYVNSNIDIIKSGNRVVNLPEIKQKNIVGGKKINDIDIINGNIYLSCEFGIVVIDVDREEIKDTYYIGNNGQAVNVNGIGFDGTSILAATDSGMYVANYNDPNIFDYHAWSKLTNPYNPNASYTSVAVVDNNFVVVKSDAALQKDSILIQRNNTWETFISYTSRGAYVDDKRNQIMYRNNDFFGAYDGNGTTIGDISVYAYTSGLISRGICDNDRTIWLADLEYGIVKKTATGDISMITPNGPGSESVYMMRIKDGQLWVASGSVLGDVPNYGLHDGIYNFFENSWKTFDLNNDSIYRLSSSTFSPAVVCAAIDPNDADHAFIGSWGSGLMEFRRSGGVAFYSHANSGLSEVNNYPGYLLLGGIGYDTDNNLWCVTGYNTNCVSVKRASGGWMTYTLPDVNFVNYLNYDLVVDDYGQKWFITHQGASTGQGVCVFKEASLTSNAGLKFKKLSDRTGSGALPDMYVRSIAKDKDGAIWLGTDKGVAVVYNPGNIFSGGNFDAQKIIIEQDGYAQYLLETEIVTAIAIDGANRKWFGTYSGGVFLMSADGTKQLLNFNIDNSPLPSNLITSIAIDNITGEVFIGTDKGIISYLGDATEGGDYCDKYYVFPNPVRHDYHGSIAIRGLVNNADVKITDVAGNLVYHTKANGGEAVWNGNKFSGERAVTGIYFVYVSNEDGTATCVTKFLMAE